jgi:hypothetical protein
MLEAESGVAGDLICEYLVRAVLLLGKHTGVAGGDVGVGQVFDLSRKTVASPRLSTPRGGAPGLLLRHEDAWGNSPGYDVEGGPLLRRRWSANGWCVGSNDPSPSPGGVAEGLVAGDG